MPAALDRIRALECATRLEVVRRPGVLLSTAGVGALLALLHQLSSATFGGGGGLAVELSLSTVALFVALVAGVTGVRCGIQAGDLGPTPALEASPLGWAGYVLGRFAGILTACLLLSLLLAPFAAVGHLVAGEMATVPVRGALVALGGIGVQAGLFAALGMLLGALAPAQLAMVLLVGFLAASRTILPTMALSDGALAALALALPDPARLDAARAAGFALPVSVASAVLAWAASAAYAAALLLLTIAAFERRAAAGRLATP